MKPLRLLTPTKVNLGLWVTRRRPDGYHDLASLFLRIPLYDELDVQILPGSTFVLESTWDLPEENTLRRAWEIFGRKPGIRVRLVKNVPAGAGLGGGSANAAGLLWTLNHLLGYPHGLDELLDLGRRVGADVPFFLHRTQAALVEGIGEEVTPLPWFWPEDWSLVLAVPPCSISTRAMYEALTPEDHTPRDKALSRIRNFLEGLASGNPDAFQHLENVFFPYAMRICQDIQNLVKVLRKRGARWISLTGTGSGVLALFDRPVNRLAEELDIPDGKLYLISPPPKHPLLPRGAPPSLPGVLIF